MTYEEFIEKALKGRTVAGLAAELGVTKMTLNRYVRGERLPDYEVALMLAHEADISPGETMLLLADEQHRRKQKDILSTGFRLLVDAWNRLISGIKPAY